MIVSLVSGKGGTGKSVLACNIAVALVRDYDKKVLLFDADLGLANADVLLGADPPTTLEHIVRDGRALDAALFTTEYGVDIVSGGSGVTELLNPSVDVRTRLATELSNVAARYDVVIIDCPPGTSRSVMSYIQASDTSLLVVTPEPTSLLDAYALVKAVWAAKPDANVRLLVNNVRNEKQSDEVTEKFEALIGRFLSRSIETTGYVRTDKSVPSSVQTRTPFVEGAPKSAASRDLDTVIETLLEMPQGETRVMLDLLREKAFAPAEDHDEEAA